MKKILSILFIVFLLFTNSSKSQGYLGRATYYFHDAVAIGGESNAKGIGSNDSASAGEIGTRSGVKIIFSNAWQTLHISNNNQSAAGEHGIELGLANSVDSGTIASPLYLMKYGVGGSTIADWIAGGVNYNAWTSRMDTGLRLLTTLNNGRKPKLYIYWNQGQNDNGVTDPDVWKANTKVVFDSLRLRYAAYGTCPIFMPYLPVSFSTFNTRITQMGSEVSEFYIIETSDALGSGSHWYYSGLKIIATRFIYMLIGHYTFH